MCGDRAQLERIENPSVYGEKAHAAAILAAFSLGSIYKDIDFDVILKVRYISCSSGLPDAHQP
jgi:hypothetical protein